MERFCGVEIPYERSTDIDDLVDFEIATFLADRKKRVPNELRFIKCLLLIKKE